MPRVGKSKDKFFVSLPPAMVAELSIKEGDEVEFLKHSDTSFIVAKKSDVVKLLEHEVKASPMPIDKMPAPALDASDIDLLMKLDTFRYSERTKEKVNAMLSQEQKATLSSLMERKVVQLYSKDPKDEFRYSIPKYIYDKFLYGKRASSKTEPVPTVEPARIVAQTTARQPMQAQTPVKKLDKMAIKKWEEKGDEGYITELENKGYLVLKNEAEAASTSAALEDSIKQGLVLGTRAFDKKFYICLRGFINRNAPKIMKIIEERSVGADEIAAQTSLDVDAVKSVLYILAEKGDVTEVRREIFRAA